MTVKPVFLAFPVRRLFRHLKRGAVYQVQSKTCRVQCPIDEPLRDDELVMLYRNVESGAWAVRRRSEFEDGRFEEVSLKEVL